LADVVPSAGQPTASVACVGEAMAVLSPDGGGALEAAQLLRRTVGGAEANVARVLSRLGVAASFVSRVGDDPFGRCVRADLRVNGVDDSAVEVDDERQTGIYVKAPRPQGSTMYYYRSSSAATAMGHTFFTPPVVDLTLRTAAIVHTSGITAGVLHDPGELLTALRRSKAAGVLVSVDLNWRPALWCGRTPDALRELLRLADVVLLGADEARSALGTDDPRELRSMVAPKATIVVKSAAHEATGLTPGAEPVAVPALVVDVAEPVGAGDAFAAGYLAGQVRGLPMAQRLRLGHLCAAMALVSPDDHAVPPERAVLDRLVRASEKEWAAVRVGAGGVSGLSRVVTFGPDRSDEQP